MKCAECHHAVYDRWFSLAVGTPGGIWVVNWCADCLDKLLSRPVRRKIEALTFAAGWVQEKLPI